MWSCGSAVVLSALLTATESVAIARNQTIADHRPWGPATARPEGPAGNDADDGIPRIVYGRAESGANDDDGGDSGDRDTRRAEPQRGQRCAVPVVTGGDGDIDDTLLEATRTVDRYPARRVQAYYEGPILYRQRPVSSAVAYVRRRRPVTVVDRPQQLQLVQQRPVDAAPAVAAVLYQSPPRPAIIGSPYVHSVVVPPDGDRRRPADEPLVSLTADEVRRVLQRVFSEGVMAGEAAAEQGGTKFTKVRSSDQT